jgi:hypothetical protein
MACTGKRCESYEATQVYVYTIKPDRSQIAALREGLIAEILEMSTDSDTFTHCSGIPELSRKQLHKRLRRMRTDDLYDLLESLT